MDNEKEEAVVEEVVEFKSFTDRMKFDIQDAETSRSMCIISGYDLDIDFNMDYLKSVDDIENCLEGLKTLFRDFIMSKLIDKQTK